MKGGGKAGGKQKTAASAAAAAAAEADRRLPAAKRRLLEARHDADDMSQDYALLKKVKKGKMSEVRRVCCTPFHSFHLCQPNASQMHEVQGSALRDGMDWFNRVRACILGTATLLPGPPAHVTSLCGVSCSPSHFSTADSAAGGLR